MSFPSSPTIRAGAALAAAVTLLAFAPGAYAASTAGFDDDELIVIGDGADNVIDVTHTGTNVYRVTDTTGVTPAASLSGCVVVDTNTVDCTDPTPAAAKRIRVAGLDGSDTLRAGFGQTPDAWGSAPVRLVGRRGNDTLIGAPGNGPGGDDELEGGEGDDLLDGAAGDDDVSGGGEFSNGGTNMGIDRAFGGPGDDTVSDGEARDDVHDNDTLNGGTCPLAGCAGGAEGATDVDRAYFYNVPGRGQPRNANMTVNLAAGTAGQAGETNLIASFEAVITGDGDDTVTGSALSEEIYTRGGDDSVQVTDGVGDLVDCGNGAGDVLRRDSIDIDSGERCEIEGPVGPPRGLTARLDGDRAVVLSWTDVAGASSYQVLRRPANSLDGSPTGEALRVGGLTEGTRYCWVVRSVNVFGVSGDSPEICAVAGRSGGSVGGGAGGPTRSQVARAVSSAAASAKRALARAGLRRLLGKGVSVGGRAPAAGTATYSLVVHGSRGARRLTLVRARTHADRAGSYTLTLKGRRAAARRLRGLRSVRATLTVGFATDAGLRASKRSRLRLRR